MLACTALVAVLAQTAAPVRLDVVMGKTSYHVGDKVEVNLVVRNLTKKPISICRVHFDGCMSADADVKILYEGKEIQVTGGATCNPAAQVMVGNEVTSDRFEYLEKGSYANIFWMNFTSQLRDLDKTPRYKGDANKRKVEITPLKPGNYEVRAFYTFTKPLTTGFGGPRSVYEFTPSAKKMFDLAYKGTLKANHKFKIEP